MLFDVELDQPLGDINKAIIIIIIIIINKIATRWSRSRHVSVRQSAYFDNLCITLVITAKGEDNGRSTTVKIAVMGAPGQLKNMEAPIKNSNSKTNLFQ
jgi:hypothetical protein